MTEAIKVLNFGKTTQVNEAGETVMTNPGRDIQARGTFWFTKIGKEKYNTKDDKGIEADFFSNLYSGLINMDEMKLIEFWVCATAYLRDKAPTEEEVMEKLQDVADHQGLKPLFKGALEVLEYSGFFKDKVANSWVMMFKGAKLEAKTEEDKEKAVEGIKMLQEMRDEILEVSPQ